MKFLQLSTITMLVMGVLAIISGLTTDIGPFGVLFGMLMLVSGIVKIIALRIMNSHPPVSSRTTSDER